MSEPNSASEVSTGVAYSRGELTRYALRLVAGFVLVFLVVVLLARQFRETLELLGHSFVDRLGFFGMGLGTFLADGFHFPIPPQAYMLMAISSGAPAFFALVAIFVGSLFGGGAAYFLGRRIAGVAWLRAKLLPLQHMFDRMWDRFGHRALLFASVAPIPYSTICWLTGINRLPTSAFWVLSAFRIPRLVVFYALIYAGWRI